MKNLSSENLLRGLDTVDLKWIDAAGNDDVLRAAVQEEAAKRERKHLIAYECKKLLGVRYLWVFLCILLLLNSVLAWYYADRSAAAAEPNDLIAEFFAEYEANPDELDAHYEKMQAFNREQEALLYAAMSSGYYDYETESMPDVYSTDNSYSDNRLFAKLYEAVDAAKNYPDVLETVIQRAELNMTSLLNMGVAEDSFTYRYQMRVIDLYKELRDNVTLQVDYSCGWEEYFSYETVNLFVFFLLMLFGSVLFSEEKQSGFLPIIRTSKHGRAKTAAAKVLTMLIVSVVITLGFTFSTFAVFGLRIGFSSPGNVLQTLPTFTYSPYRITVGQYFLITVGMKLLSFALFSMLLVVCAVFFYNMVLVFFAVFSVFGISFLLNRLQYTNANNLFKNLNLITAASVTRLFERYRALNLFGEVIGFVPAMFVLFPVLILVCSAVTVYRFANYGDAVRIPFVDNAVSFAVMQSMKLTARLRAAGSLAHKTAAVRLKTRTYSSSLLLAESFKTLISSRFFIIVLAILCAKGLYSSRVNAPSNSYADIVYKEYMTELEGELTEKKLAYLADERQYINDTLAKQIVMKEAFLAETISFEEYREYLSEYNYAYSRNELLSVIESHADYLQRKEAETGVHTWFVYDTGWNKLYGGDADLFLYASILLLFVGSFAAEYVTKSSSGGFAQLLRSTKNGREKTFYAKLISSCVIALILTVLTIAIDTATVFHGYTMPALNAPLCSIETFSAVTGSVTVGEYLILFALLRIAAAQILTLLVCALSELLEKYLPALSCAVLITLLPALCVSFGLTFAIRVNFLNLFAATPLFIASAGRTWFGSGYSMLILWLVIAVTSVLAMLYPAKKMFVK